MTEPPPTFTYHATTAEAAKAAPPLEADLDWTVVDRSLEAWEHRPTLGEIPKAETVKIAALALIAKTMARARILRYPVDPAAVVISRICLAPLG